MMHYLMRLLLMQRLMMHSLNSHSLISQEALLLLVCFFESIIPFVDVVEKLLTCSW
jgi:hypothetical protein